MAFTEKILALSSECTAGIEFGKGNPAYVAGMSGIELARVVLEGVYAGEFPKPVFSFAKSPEYWAGWALAQYQGKCVKPTGTVPLVFSLRADVNHMRM